MGWSYWEHSKPEKGLSEKDNSAPSTSQTGRAVPEPALRALRERKATAELLIRNVAHFTSKRWEKLTDDYLDNFLLLTLRRVRLSRCPRLRAMWILNVAGIWSKKVAGRYIGVTLRLEQAVSLWKEQQMAAVRRDYEARKAELEKGTWDDDERDLLMTVESWTMGAASSFQHLESTIPDVSHWFEMLHPWREDGAAVCPLSRRECWIMRWGLVKDILDLIWEAVELQKDFDASTVEENAEILAVLDRWMAEARAERGLKHC